MAREALDKHLQVAGNAVKKGASMGDMLGALPKMMGFYSWWYPSLFFGMTFTRYRSMGVLGAHLRFTERACRRLARTVFHGMVVHQAKLEKKQGFLFRAVEIANELLAISASTARAQAMKDRKAPHWEEAVELADVFATDARTRINDWFRDMWRNADVKNYRVGASIVDGRHAWLEGDKLG